MTYPQPNADQYALKGYSYFRLNTLLSSAGDIYESAQGSHAFAIGPESDVAKVNIAYFDDQVDTYVQQTAISPDRPFVGFVAARNNSYYAPIQRPGKILMWSDAIYNSDYLPTGFNPNTDIFTYYKPRLDLFQYFKPQDSLYSTRNDKEYLFQKLAFPSRSYYLMVPYYGRRYAMVTLENRTNADIDYQLIGVNFAIAENNIVNYNQEVVLATGTTVVGTTPTVLLVTAQANGMFDYLRFKLTGAGGAGLVGPSPLKIIVSDRVS